MIFGDGNEEVKERERRGRAGHRALAEAVCLGQLGRQLRPCLMLSSMEDRIRMADPLIL